MSKSQIDRLNVYANDLKTRLSDLKAGHIPAKHKTRLPQFKQYLENELKTVTSTIERLKLEAK